MGCEHIPADGQLPKWLNPPFFDFFIRNFYDFIFSRVNLAKLVTYGNPWSPLRGIEPVFFDPNLQTQEQKLQYLQQRLDPAMGLALFSAPRDALLSRANLLAKKKT